jgi:hypothetical protein
VVAVDPRESGKALKKMPAILKLFGSRFGSYPFGVVGGVVDHAPQVGYALETQTKPLFDRTLATSRSLMSSRTNGSVTRSR